MNSTFGNDFGKLLLRWCVGFLMIFHGYSKFNNGLGFIEKMLESNGLPAFFAYGAYVGEILAPILLIIGYQTRFAATMIIATMLMAIYLVHPADITALTEHGALVLELQYFYILTAFALIFMGAGRYSVDKA